VSHVPPAPEQTLVQLSDLHILPPGQLLHGVIDTFANLEAAIEVVAASAANVTGLLLTGDLADTGDPAAYRRLRELVEAAAARWGATVVYAMGNHDDRPAFRRELLSAAPTSEPCDQVHWLGSTRVIVMDSTIPGHHHGALAPAQLAWLSAELARPAAQGTVLMLHHPPLPSPVPPVDLLRLRDAERLTEVVAGSDIRIILCGHAHHVSVGSLAGIPVWVAPAVAYAIDTMPPLGRQRGAVGGAFSRIDLIRGTTVATAVPIAAATSVYDRDEAEMVRLVTDLVARAG
jgi:3',5'-cyclic AMP phosphodiesterase CpdA